MWGQKQQMTIAKARTQLQIFCVSCMPTTIMHVLQSNVRHIGSWNCLEVMHKSNYIEILVVSSFS